MDVANVKREDQNRTLNLCPWEIFPAFLSSADFFQNQRF